MPTSDPYAFRMPTPGDQLLNETNDQRKGIRFDKSVQQYLLSDGYFTAALRLLDICTDEMEIYRHVLIFPVLFCYRHGFELAVKEIVEKFGRIAKIESSKLSKDHSLNKAWNDCRKVIIEICGEMEHDQYLESIDQLIAEFESIDKTAETFRYASNKSGEILDLPEGTYDLENLKKSITSTKNFFTGAYNMIGDYADKYDSCN